MDKAPYSPGESKSTICKGSRCPEGNSTDLIAAVIADGPPAASRADAFALATIQAKSLE
jgi:hypothetical protein